MQFQVQENGCHIFQGSKDESGYGMVWHQGRSRRAHRVILSEATGVSIDHPLVAMHTCDTPSCVNHEHLRWGTRGENNTDRSNKGRNGDFKGALNPAAKLTQEDVTAIRSRPLSISGMAKKWGVSTTHIKRILRGQSWQTSSPS